MKKSFKELMTAGIVVPAMILSLAACGASGSTEAKSADETPAAAETAEETAAAEEQTQTTGEDKVYENGGFKLTVTADMADKITVETPEKSEDGVLFDVYETASVEAAKANGNENLGSGWLFAICVRNEDEVHKIMCDSFGGEDILAYDADGNYYVYYHPTDVRYERETPEKMAEDQDAWTAACEWANNVKTQFLNENGGMTEFHFGGSEIETAFARILYKEDTKYTLSTTEFGPLEPNGVDPEPYVSRLMKGASFEYVDEEAPDGEYVVLNFPEEDCRYDFFVSTDKVNYIRKVWNEEQDQEMIKVTYDDGTTNAAEIMQEWYHAIADAGK